MRKWLLSLAIVAMISAPALAAFSPVVVITPVNTGVLGYNGADRPTVDIGPLGPTINWANVWFNGAPDPRVPPVQPSYGSRWTDASGTAPTMTEILVAADSSATGHTAWGMESGIAGEWAVYGGPPLNGPFPLNVENITTGVVTSISLAGDPAQHHNFTDVNENGDVFWLAWDATLRHANVAAPGTVNTLMSAPNYQRMRAADATDRAALDPDGTEIGIYDLGWDGPDAAGYYTVAVEVDLDPLPPDHSDPDPLNWVENENLQKFYKSEISDDGTLVVTNCRYSGPGWNAGNVSDIVLFDVQQGLGTTVQVNLTGDNVNAPTTERNDPSITRIDNDTALIVWDEKPDGFYKIVGMYVTGLATSSPVAGDVFNIATAGPLRNLRYADIDGNLVAWKNMSTGDIEYRFIPEPATLALMGLGVLALARRR
jgi:hypothetical protein